ncbi:putative transcriptional regulator, TetR/AcrR family protein [Listeria weihenstephanensis FSL R9-0317]|uniref:TetR family transcriptional regulator n=1 Tax=Listeria weihenstephanensis TaxID=1006155 RepID=A0A1S7FSJ1_9LIST|nr:TetR/AcrR family transcriptional regulator [Listeria weihenstephanensis]AQY50416.1 TetR family transcriptional regulator [Listeria weihenstephanensis]EUJ41426.1 putative transcriptional regulator, TetR/AcrR family protein [Listeria weihenstephanensis FSL R9-0317]MBC1501599.1 TetR/AcrR family transcriptional regulator [Listeria weihenstephanensis]
MSKSQLKEAALPLFAEQGYEGTALSEIAKAVGIKTPSIYAHFASKEALFMEIYRDVMKHELVMLDEVVKETHSTVREALHAFFYKVTDFNVDPQVKRFFQRAIFFPPQALAKQMREEMTTYEALTSQSIGAILVQTLDKAQQENWIYVFYCLLDGLSLEHEIYSKEDFEKRRDAAWSALEALLA